MPLANHRLPLLHVCIRAYKSCARVAPSAGLTNKHANCSKGALSGPDPPLSSPTLALPAQVMMGKDNGLSEGYQRA
eukprot:1160127-Pelagomonas_calceolata.AAC.9